MSPVIHPPEASSSWFLLELPAVRRVPFDAAAVALALDELRHAAGHLREQQAHRDVGQCDAESERDGESENDDDGGDER